MARSSWTGKSHLIREDEKRKAEEWLETLLLEGLHRRDLVAHFVYLGERGTRGLKIRVSVVRFRPWPPSNVMILKVVFERADLRASKRRFWTTF